MKKPSDSLGKVERDVPEKASFATGLTVVPLAFPLIKGVISFPSGKIKASKEGVRFLELQPECV